MNAVNQFRAIEYERSKERWEQTRAIALMVLNTSQVRQSDKNRVRKDFKFPWDQPDGAIGESSLTKQDMDRIKKNMEKLDK